MNDNLRNEMPSLSRTEDVSCDSLSNQWADDTDDETAIIHCPRLQLVLFMNCNSYK